MSRGFGLATFYWRCIFKARDFDERRWYWKRLVLWTKYASPGEWMPSITRVVLSGNTMAWCWFTVVEEHFNFHKKSATWTKRICQQATWLPAIQLLAISPFPFMLLKTFSKCRPVLFSLCVTVLWYWFDSLPVVWSSQTRLFHTTQLFWLLSLVIIGYNRRHSGSTEATTHFPRTIWWWR